MEPMRGVAGFLLLLASCTACAATAATVPFATLAKGLASGVGQPIQIVARSQTDWAALWSRHMRIQIAPPPAPSVDFSRDMVVALFMGERPTGGYAIEVMRIERTDPVTFVAESRARRCARARPPRRAGPQPRDRLRRARPIERRASAGGAPAPRPPAARTTD